MRINLEENVSKLVDDHKNTLTSTIKERDHAFTLIKVLKKENAEFVGGHDRTQKDLEKLKEEHKALESKFSSLFEAHEQLQTQLTCDLSKSSAVQIIDLSSSPNPCCKHEHLIEEVKVLKDQLAKTKKKKKNNNNKKKKNKGMAQGVPNGLTLLQSDNFAGKNNPSYIL